MSETKKHIKIKPFRFWHLPALADMVATEWNLGHNQSGTPKKICAWLYALEIAACGTELFTAVKNNHPVGFCGYDNWQYKHLHQKIYARLYNLLFYSPLIKKRHILEAYNQYYNYIPQELKTEENCELDIIIIDKNIRGCGLGQQLFQHTINHATAKGYKKLIIETDDSCSVRFYDKAGCKCLKIVSIGSEEGNTCANENCYLYELNLSTDNP